MRDDFIPATVEYIGNEGKAIDKFTIGKTYDAYFIEYWEGVRNSLHVRNNDGKIVDFVPFEEFKVIEDPQGVLELREALVKYIVEDEEPDPLSLLTGNVYHAVGRDKDGYYLVEDESGCCYFYEASSFEIISDPDGILSQESVYYSLYGNMLGNDDSDGDTYVSEGGEDDDKYKFVKLITGERLYVREKQIVGFCHCALHPGTLTKNLVKTHECDIKNCYYLRQYAEKPFWKAREDARKAKQMKKEKIKQKKKQEQDKKESLLHMAQNCADEMMMPIKITSVQKLTGEKTYTIFYISEEAINDAYMYAPLSEMFTWLVGIGSRLRHVKDLNGRYAVI